MHALNDAYRACKMESRATAISGDMVEGYRGTSLSFQFSGALQSIRRRGFDGNLIFYSDMSDPRRNCEVAKVEYRY